MITSGIEQLRQFLADDAGTLEAVKHVHDRACALADEAVADKDFVTLDAAVELRMRCTKKGGDLLFLLAGTERPPGIDAELWTRRSKMDEAAFAAAVAKARVMARRRAGDPSPRGDGGGTGQDKSPQSRTLLTQWFVDELGFPTRYVVGVCAGRWKQMIASGRDPKKIEAELVAEVLEHAAQLGPV